MITKKPYVIGVFLRGQYLSLKCGYPLELIIHFRKVFRSFHTCNIGFLGQRPAKLLAAKVGIHKKKSAASAITAELCASAFCTGLSSNHSQI